MSTSEDTPRDDQGLPTHRGLTTPVVAIVEHYEDEPDECTLYPTAASETELVTTWITAQEGGFVSLSNCR